MNIRREIVNRALDKAGEEPILDKEWEDGTSVRVRLIKDYYLATILETLSKTEWTSRKKRAELVEDESPNLTNNSYKYILPKDCAKPISITDDAEYIVEGRSLLTDAYKPILLYVSNGYTGENKYKEADPQPTEETWESMKYFYQDENEHYILADEYDEEKTYFEIEHDDYDGYEDIEFDPLLSEYIETRLAAKMTLKLTGKMDLYRLLYSESVLMEQRAATASEAHGFNKATGNEYWGDILGLPDYGE